MIRASIQRVLLQAISRANGQITAGDVRAAQMIATNVHLDSGLLITNDRFFYETPLFQELVAFAVNKAIADSAGINELYAAHLFKNVSEVVSMGTVSDIATKDFGKGLIETPAISDTLIYDLDKHLADVGVMTDVAAKAFSRPVTDSFTSADAYVNAFGKNPSDTSVASDSAPIFVVDKAPSDTADMSDVLVRFMVYNRSLSDSVSVSDSLSTEVNDGRNRYPNNSAGVGDVAALTVNKPFSESSSATDAHIYAFSKTVSEAPSVSEVLAKATSLVKSDGANAADIPLILLQKAFGTGLATGNTADASDSAAFSFGANKSNTFDAADAFAAAFSKTLEDPANCSSTGVLAIQNYVGSGYFAGDFVGDNRTLT